MYYVYMLTRKNLTKEWKHAQRTEEPLPLATCQKWKMVHLQPICHVTDTLSASFLTVRKHSHLVTAFNEALSDGVAVCLDASEVRCHVVRAHQYAVLDATIQSRVEVWTHVALDAELIILVGIEIKLLISIDWLNLCQAIFQGSSILTPFFLLKGLYLLLEMENALDALMDSMHVSLVSQMER